MDGMHRVLKAVLAGLSHIPAVRFSSDPVPDYVGVDPNDLPYEQGSQLTPNSPWKKSESFGMKCLAV
jgi:hypothetical protein